MNYQTIATFELSTDTDTDRITQLTNSMREGTYDGVPIVVHAANKELVTGLNRYTAAQALDIELEFYDVTELDCWTSEDDLARLLEVEESINHALHAMAEETGKGQAELEYLGIDAW